MVPDGALSSWARFRGRPLGQPSAPYPTRGQDRPEQNGADPSRGHAECTRGRDNARGSRLPSAVSSGTDRASRVPGLAFACPVPEVSPGGVPLSPDGLRLSPEGWEGWAVGCSRSKGARPARREKGRRPDTSRCGARRCPSRSGTARAWLLSAGFEPSTRTLEGGLGAVPRCPATAYPAQAFRFPSSRVYFSASSSRMAASMGPVSTPVARSNSLAVGWMRFTNLDTSRMWLRSG